MKAVCGKINRRLKFLKKGGTNLRGEGGDARGSEFFVY